MDLKQCAKRGGLYFGLLYIMALPKQRHKRKLQGSSPPKSKAKGGKSSEADCLICEELILEANDERMHCTAKVSAKVGCTGNVPALPTPPLRELVNQLMCICARIAC